MFSSPALLLPTVIPPVFVLIAFAGGLSKLAGGFSKLFGYPLGYAAFIFVFATLQAAHHLGVFTGFTVARDFGTGFSPPASPHRAGTTPAPAAARSSPLGWREHPSSCACSAPYPTRGECVAVGAGVDELALRKGHSYSRCSARLEGQAQIVGCTALFEHSIQPRQG